MAARKGMSRLSAVYSMMEQMRSVERRAAAVAVEETLRAAAIAAEVRDGHVFAGRAAMAQGDREEWSIAVTTRGVIEARIERLAEVRVEREATLVEAITEHHASRLQVEQLERLLASARLAEALDEGRREQMVADDRYGSRLAWRRVRDAE